MGQDHLLYSYFACAYIEKAPAITGPHKVIQRFWRISDVLGTPYFNSFFHIIHPPLSPNPKERSTALHMASGFGAVASLKPFTDEQVFYDKFLCFCQVYVCMHNIFLCDKFLCDKFFLPVCTSQQFLLSVTSFLC